MADNYIVEYPVLAYKTSLPMDNEIAFVNLIHNEPQKFLNISPYRFVQFVDTGLNPEFGLDPFVTDGSMNTCIFFIVQRD